MSHARTLPSTVKPFIAAYCQLVESHLMPPLMGLYLVGSVALDDYRPGLSDIDFVALFDTAPTVGACTALSRVHATMAEAGGPCMDGCYVTSEALRQPPKDYAIVPFSLDGRFRTGELCREINPVTWRCLARSGLTVFGPHPTELDIADDENLLRSYQIRNVRSYWMSWINECALALAAKAPGQDCDAAALAWGVLGISRIAGSLETKRVLSKVEGGRHAIAVQQACWHPIIRKAMSAHFGTVKRVPIKTVVDGLAYMRAVAGQVARAG